MDKISWMTVVNSGYVYSFLAVIAVCLILLVQKKYDNKKPSTNK